MLLQWVFGEDGLQNPWKEPDKEDKSVSLSFGENLGKLRKGIP